MPVLQTDSTQVDSNDLVKVEFKTDSSAPLGERADLLVLEGPPPVLARTDRVTNIPALQQLRELVGGGTGDTGWVRVRRSGAVGDNEDSYVNLSQVSDAEFASAQDGAVARLKAENEIPLGEVHLPDALRKVHDLGLT
jgi:hypothetical protein